VLPSVAGRADPDERTSGSIPLRHTKFGCARGATMVEVSALIAPELLVEIEADGYVDS